MKGWYHYQRLSTYRAMAAKLSTSRLFSALAIAGCLATGISAAALAQGTPGLTIFSGIERGNELRYRLDFDGRPSAFDRYRLRIPKDKLTTAVAQLSITYPQTYRGTFDKDSIKVRVNGDDVPLDEVNWDRENRTIDIFPRTPIPADSRVEVVLDNVRNPSNGGTHYFNALVRSPGDIPLMRYVGTWIISIGTI